MPARPISVCALVIIWGITSSPAFAQTTEQFDLVCDETMRIDDPRDEPQKRVTQRKAHYRIDLSNLQFCYGDCESVYQIEQTPTVSEIDLRHVEKWSMGNIEKNFMLNRTTGSIEKSWSIGAATFKGDGPCVAAPFSGFPKSKF